MTGADSALGGYRNQRSNGRAAVLAEDQDFAGGDGGLDRGRATVGFGYRHRPVRAVLLVHVRQASVMIGVGVRKPSHADQESQHGNEGAEAPVPLTMVHRGEVC